MRAQVGPTPQRDVFIVGPDTAIGDPLLGFKPTRVELTSERMDDHAKRDLVRSLLAEQGFAHRALPLGAPGLTLHANGRLTTNAEELKKRLYEKGSCAAPGDRVMVTDLVVLPDRILIDVNGGPYLPHRFLRHISINGTPLTGNGQVGESATGTRITLLFEGPTPRLTAPEVKSLLEPLLDFGLKSSEQAYADTLPEPIKRAIDEHEIMVGMNRRMVLAALGQPESKLRERAANSTTGEVFEEWIYGHAPQTVRFVRFRGQEVILLKVAALGKPIEVRDKDELAAYHEAPKMHVIELGDTATEKQIEGQAVKGPSLKTAAEQTAAKAPDTTKPTAGVPDANPSPTAPPVVR